MLPVVLDQVVSFRVPCIVPAQVLEAIRGLRTIYSGKGAKLVPLKERAAAVSVNRQAKAAIERDSWVRVRGGLYKDDLAKVGQGCWAHRGDRCILRARLLLGVQERCVWRLPVHQVHV